MRDSLFSMKRKRQCRLYSLLVLLCSCSSPEWILDISRSNTVKKDFKFGREHRDSLLFYIQRSYTDFTTVNSKEVRQYPERVTDYLNSLVALDESNKELSLDYSYYFWKSKEAFYFVSPSGEVVLSEGFVEKFIQTEDILKVVLMECYLRKKYSVYNFKTGFPTGYRTVSNLSSLMRVDLTNKHLLNMWIYVLLKNNKTDTNSILYWMQEKIRAEKESYLISGGRRDSLKEEQLIKEYLLKKGIYNEEEDFNLQSNKFFKFKREFLSW